MNDNRERTRVWRRIGVIVLFAAAWIAASEAGPSPVAAQEGAEVVEAPADYGVWSLVPAVLALVVAFATKQVLLALALGVATACAVVFAHSGNYVDLNPITRFLLPALGTEKFAKILLIYLWFLGGILGVWERTGGPRYFAQRIGARLARGRRGSKVFAWLVGCIFHQGGTVSTVLAGTTVRPVADANRVSHEELSYIVDSTASPIATLLPFNAWPVFVGGLAASGAAVGGFKLIEDEQEGVAWFLSSIPYNFYAMFAVLSTLLLSVEMLPWAGGRMRAAMRRARETGQLDAEGAQPLMTADVDRDTVHPGYRTGLVDFFVPLGVLLGMAIIPYLYTGNIAIGEAFLGATLSAMTLAFIKGMPLRVIFEAFVDGCASMTLGALILGLAVTMGGISADLNTATYLISIVGDAIPPWSLPVILTLLCMVISFSIGSSFGTYAVIFPLAIPLALTVALQSKGIDPALAGTIADSRPDDWADILFYVHICFGSVMGGAVFGDQCSPISDTTILSSMFTGCDLMDHVRTQLPLSLAAAALGALCSTALTLLA